MHIFIPCKTYKTLAGLEIICHLANQGGNAKKTGDTQKRRSALKLKPICPRLTFRRKESRKVHHATLSFRQNSIRFWWLVNCKKRKKSNKCSLETKNLNPCSQHTELPHIHVCLYNTTCCYRQWPYCCWHLEVKWGILVWEVKAVLHFFTFF